MPDTLYFTRARLHHICHVGSPAEAWRAEEKKEKGKSDASHDWEFEEKKLTSPILPGQNSASLTRVAKKEGCAGVGFP